MFNLRIGRLIGFVDFNRSRKNFLNYFYHWQTFCMPSSASNILFFVTRGVAAAGNGLIGIYSSNIYQARVRSLASGLCAAAFRLGILTAPYVGQVLLQDRSTVIAIATFAGVAIIGAISSILLPKLRAPYSVSST